MVLSNPVEKHTKHRNIQLLEKTPNSKPLNWSTLILLNQTQAKVSHLELVFVSVFICLLHNIFQTVIQPSL